MLRPHGLPRKWTAPRSVGLGKPKKLGPGGATGDRSVDCELAEFHTKHGATQRRCSDIDGATVQLNGLPDNRQAEAHSPAGAVPPTERTKQIFRSAGQEPGSSVFHGGAAARSRGNPNSGARRRVFDRVSHQIDQGLAHCDRISEEVARLLRKDLNVMLLGFCPAAQPPYGVFCNSPDIEVDKIR